MAHPALQTVMGKPLTLVLVHTDSEILLGMKKRGFGQGLFNGFGGKLEAGETVLQAAHRELAEEASISADLTEIGILHFEFEGDPQLLEVHVFSSKTWTGTPVESEEMAPQWFPLSNIPYDQMWADDRIWLPLLLAGQEFTGYFKFRKTEILAHKLVKQRVAFEDVKLD